MERGGQSDAIGLANAEGGALAMPGYARSGWLVRVRQSIATEFEAEQERWFLWIAVAFGAGVALYFALSVEPHATLKYCYINICETLKYLIAWVLHV